MALLPRDKLPDESHTLHAYINFVWPQAQLYTCTYAAWHQNFKVHLFSADCSQTSIMDICCKFSQWVTETHNILLGKLIETESMKIVPLGNLASCCTYISNMYMYVHYPNSRRGVMCTAVAVHSYVHIIHVYIHAINMHISALNVCIYRHRRRSLLKVWVHVHSGSCVELYVHVYMHTLQVL